MKKAKGTLWKYNNSPGRGITWAAELSINGSLICCYGQKKMYSAIKAARKLAKQVGWEIIGWEKENENE